VLLGSLPETRFVSLSHFAYSSAHLTVNTPNTFLKTVQLFWDASTQVEEFVILIVPNDIGCSIDTHNNGKAFSPTRFCSTVLGFAKHASR